MFNVILYSLIFILVVWAMDGININSIFKKNKVYQARVFYILVVICLTYLVTNFLLDFLILSK